MFSRLVWLSTILVISSAPLVSSFSSNVDARTQSNNYGLKSLGTSERILASSRSGLPAAQSDDDFESLMPETSFGAESVPEAQRPANEYLDLIRQPLFGWASEETGSTGLALRLAAVYGVFFGLVCYPISGATYTQDGYLLQKLAASNVGSLFVVLFLLLRLYSGWGYVGSRLKSKTIEFEETGWYDGDIEEKTEAEKARDLFLYRSNVKPVEERLKLFSIAIGGIWVASCIGLNVAVSSKPLFNEYNPALLERIQYDDKLAGVAAQQSGGRPTYCDSRYYRAVANGGQGCDR